MEIEDTRSLEPESFLSLQIHIDRLHRAAEECRVALRRMRRGEITPADYQQLLGWQLAAQREWEAKNREYFRWAD